MAKVELIEERDDTWWITDEVLSLAVHIVAQQFIHDQDKLLYTPEEFAERVTYVMRQHCPIVYSYFYQASSSDTLPRATVQLVLHEVKKVRTLFTVSALG